MERHPAVLGPAAKLQAHERWRRHRHAIGATGKRQPVVQYQPDDFAKAQGDDGQVVAMHPQHRKAQYAPGQRRRDRRQWQHSPEAQAQVLVTQGQAIGADGVEGHVAQVEQAGKAHHDVQAQAQQHVDQAEDDHGQQVLVGEERKDDGNHDQCRDDPAQPRFVVWRQHVHAGAAALEALEDRLALGCLQEQAEQETPGHDPGHQPGNAGGFKVEAVAVEHHADDGPEYDQGNQPGENRIDQAALDIECSCIGSRHTYTFATSGRPSRPWGRKIRISTSSEKLNTSL
ncbi:hypothetical protein D3C81_1341050 [compost metagenome]